MKEIKCVKSSKFALNFIDHFTQFYVNPWKDSRLMKRTMNFRWKKNHFSKIISQKDIGCSLAPRFLSHLFRDPFSFRETDDARINRK